MDNETNKETNGEAKNETKSEIIKDIHIQNFKGIKDLKIEGFNLVNVLIGENGCGKTTILEGIFQISSLRSVDFIYSSIYNGSYVDSNDNKLYIHSLDDKITDIINVFHNHENHNDVVISSNNITIKFNSNNEYLVFINNSLTMELGDLENKNIYDIEKQFNYFSPLIAEYFSKYQRHVRFLHTKLTNDIFSLLYFLPLHKEEVVKTMQKIDSNLIKIEIEDKKVFLYFKNIKGKINIQNMGSGFIRIIYFVSRLISFKYESFTHGVVVLIDELETALHHSSVKMIVDMMFDIAKEKNIQFFIATHSFDVISAFAGKMESDDDEICNIFRIENFKKNDSHEFTKFTKEDVKDFTNYDFIIMR